MTNSIATAKCPSILASGKYGMSQRRSIIDDSKEYIFVKLTDSAFRAIEEYQRSAQSKRLQKGQCAKIQFIGNAGVIQFPPPVDNSTSSGSSPSDGRKFGFAIDDVEGSLECIQQSGNDLDVLGSLSYRMRIHANDDVYDTTRTKMAIAEETEKSKCIREIKPNQTDIGRKVKRPISAASIQAYSNGTTISSLLNGNGISSSGGNSNSINGSSSYLSNSNNNHISSSSNNNSRNKLSTTTLNQHSPPLSGAGGGGGGSNGSGGVGVNGSRMLSNSSSLRSSPNPTSIGGNGTVGVGSNRYGSPSNPSSNMSILSTNMLNGVGGISPPASGNNILSGTQQQRKPNSRGNGASVGKGSLANNGKINGISNGKSVDVSRRKIRERLIQLLALKNFKKPELYSRLQNEGLAQRERQLISTILKDISLLARDNTYHLRRSMWNDVDENWPFFSEQEIQQLKRRKPQNLTPPTSSDAGSSISGQSPTSSTHTGSPPPLVTSHMNGGGIKRTSLEPDFYDGTLTLGMQSKKQRISHYKKDIINSVSSLTNNSNLVAGTRIAGLANGNNSNNSSYIQNHKSAYSPHTYNAANNNGNDENSGNTDLSFNVLNNMDDFIQNTATVAGCDLSYTGRSKNSSSTNKNTGNTTSNSNCNNTNSISNNLTSQISTKEKRNSGGSNSSSGYGSNRELSSSSLSSVMRSKTSPTPYANNFVPETKISSNSNGSNSSSSRLSKPQQMQKRQKQTSPNCNNLSNHHPQKLANSNNSVISNTNDDFSSSLAVPTSQTTSNNHPTNLTCSRSQHHLNSSEATNGRRYGESSSSNKHSRSSTPTQKNIKKHHSDNTSNNNKTNLSASHMTQQQLQNNNYNHQAGHLQQQQSDQQPVLTDDCTSSQIASHSSQQKQEQEHSSPTQQIAAAASTFSLTNHSTSSGAAPRYDFSSYTPITSIEQRRKYKTEFESDYDEYRKLLAQIESVGHRFRELADRLSRVQQGCIDYYNIKDQIVSEYNHIRNEESINRDKQRFDYLHEKLAHIKQLVMDYDKKLTSGLAAPTIPSNQQQLKQVSPNQHQQQVTVTNNPAHLSPMLQSSGESNHSPPLMILNPTSTVNITNSSSSVHTKKSSKLQKDHQQQHQERFKQHHEPETIQMVNGNTICSNHEETALQCNHQTYNNFETGDNNYINRQQQVASPENSIQQQRIEQQQKYQENQNNDSDSESDSSSSSSSNDDDNSEDDNSDASEDENSDDDSNDDDNDNQ